MRIDRSFLGWGIFFVVAGAVPLAVQNGVLPTASVERWWSVWPLILIGAGLGLILVRTPFDGLGGLLVAATFGLMVGGAAASGGFGSIGDFPSAVCGPGDGGTTFASQRGTLGAQAEVDIELDCGDLTIGMTTTGEWSVDGRSEDGTPPQVETDPSSLAIRPGDDGPSVLDRRVEWDVRLPTTSALDLELDMNAGRLTADLAGAQLGVVTLDLNAGSASLQLGQVADIDGFELGVNAGSLTVGLPAVTMTGSIEANAGSVTLCAPEGVALRLHTGDSVLSSQDFASAGLVENGDVWETPGYDTAVTRIELRTEANAGSFQLDPEEGCS
ncbi:MAG TPA: hypothetical protein VD763_14240 [Candidatus Saccharimonadales bacterium]|nr:hypothetical protein [Candidatus Saccharimonadales bacterium]